MKHLIKHLLENNTAEILAKSYKHCHVKGLHSIMLLESPGKTIRLYMADLGHELDKNFPFEYQNGMSLGFHPHHSNLTLHMVKGNMFNWTAKEDLEGDLVFNKYEYHSKIIEGEMNFKLLEIGAKLKTERNHILSRGQSITMKANEIHTVGCAADCTTAWLVYEGERDPNYKPFCWTNVDPNTIDQTGLYERIDNIDEVYRLLNIVELI